MVKRSGCAHGWIDAAGVIFNGSQLEIVELNCE